jgi:hypothetical protein
MRKWRARSLGNSVCRSILKENILGRCPEEE